MQKVIFLPLYIEGATYYSIINDTCDIGTFLSRSIEIRKDMEYAVIEGTLFAIKKTGTSDSVFYIYQACSNKIDELKGELVWIDKYDLSSKIEMKRFLKRLKQLKSEQDDY